MGNTIGFILSSILAWAIIQLGGGFADYFDLSRTVTIFWGGVFYIIFELLSKLIYHALPSQDGGA